MTDEKDYKGTLNLPATDFPMKASLPHREPEHLKRWADEGLYEKMRSIGEGREKYILHDGPPYANGHIHIGHALNKLLKDFIIKSRFMMGYATEYVPGWDCHGLPIELQVEKKLGKAKLTATTLNIRKACRDYAKEFVDIQKEEFKRLGVLGDWDNPYLTMNHAYQACILKEFGKVAEEGLVYKGKKPVHWCSSCGTALAEAEVEHADKTSPSVYVAFELNKGEVEARLSYKIDTEKVSIVIWTTTPWTLPANLAVAMHPELEYSIVNANGESYIVASGLLETLREKFGWAETSGATVTGTLAHADLEGLKAQHPFIDRESVILSADFVTLEAGTGIVHIAPGHGQDDYELGLKHGLDIYTPVNNHGKFTSDVPEFEGLFVFKANTGIIELLSEKGALLKTEDISHSYPHCWRCKKAVIFRATEQWFVSMDKPVGGSGPSLREKALKAIKEDVEWIPGWGRERIYAMIENRPDWCLSRQRAWGVPIPALICAKCGGAFIDQGVVARLIGLFKEKGADVWFEAPLGELVPDGTKCPDCEGTEFEKEENILDVWFDSGVSFSSVLETNKRLGFPADLYLEGSDQHRGWFHSSLLAGIATRGVPPYKNVLTHGFVVDGKGKKMSKSFGNVISPDEIIKKYGAEVLRLWVASEDYQDDMRISNEIVKRISEAYRRIRNTFRYILGNISDFDPVEDMVEYDELTELDRYVLSRLSGQIDATKINYEFFQFHKIYHSLHGFCTVDLSNLYLDILKDRLYTSKKDSVERRAAQTTIYHILDTLTRLLAPILVFTTDEAWSVMPGEREESVHLASFPKSRLDWLDGDLMEKWQHDILPIKAEISKALEIARKEKVIGHPLDARVELVPEEESKERIDWNAEAVTLREVLIVSQLEILGSFEDEGNIDVFISSGEIKGLKILISKAKGDKCARCWHYSESVGSDEEDPTVCGRCLTALR